MPELPEVERAAKKVRDIGSNSKISKVETVDDTIVFSGITSREFENEITGRTLKTATRYGKVFYFELAGEGRMPVLHFGMTGNLQVRGETPFKYQEGPKTPSANWPPKFMKFNIHLENSDGAITELAFTDPRRLGRIRLCADPLSEPPISDLGFDPILSMPTLEDYTPLVQRRSCPVKALLLDQSFNAGVGNWVADEILYNSRVHPEARCNVLTDEQIKALHENTSSICRQAVAVNADSNQFPEHWLFKHRWGKGKKRKHNLILPDGSPATIKWITVGGRTSAYVVELQATPSSSSVVPIKRKRRKNVKPMNDGESSELTELSDTESTTKEKRKASQNSTFSSKRKRRKVSS